MFLGLLDRKNHLHITGGGNGIQLYNSFFLFGHYLYSSLYLINGGLNYLAEIKGKSYQFLFVPGIEICLLPSVVVTLVTLSL